MRTATVFNFLVESTLIGSVLILAAVVFRALLRRKLGSRCLMILWILVALRLLLPIALPNPVMNWLKPTLSADAGIRPMADQVRVRVGDAAHALYWKTLGADTNQSILHSLVWRVVYATRNGRFSRLALTLYLCGAVLSGLWILGKSSMFLLSVKRGKRRALPDAYQDVYRALCTRWGMKHPPRVWMVSRIPGSCSFDLLRPVIILPDNAAPEDIPAMLERELCSIRRLDRLWVVVRNLCCVLHWFNPLVWLAAWLCRTDMCLATDEYALRRQTNDARRLYAQPLIHTPETHHARPSLMVASTPLTLRDRQMALRIRMILHPAQPSTAARTVFSLCCCVVMAGMFATAEQSSLANLPTLTTPSLRTEGLTLSTPEEACAYAAAFLALEGVEAEDGFVEPTLTRTTGGWTAEWYVPGAQMFSQLSFTDQGAIGGYISGEVVPTTLQPLANPITTDNGEGQQWCAFLSALIETHMPELWNQYEAMEIVSSGRLDGMQYITVSLLAAPGDISWQAVVQIAPVGRLISLLPVVG